MPDLTESGALTSGRPIMSTMWGFSPQWYGEVDFYWPSEVGGPRDLWRLFRMARRHRVVILLGAVSLKHRYRDLVLALLLKAVPRRRRPRMLITDATWETQSRTMARLTRLPPGLFGLPFRALIRLIDGPEVTYGVLSRAEVETFPATWGVDPARVVFTPYFATIEPDTAHSVGSHLFCGGNSLRDYATLEAAVRDLEVEVVVGSSWRPHGHAPNIRASFLSQADYDAAMTSARAVVVPLERTERSAGQQTYLNAMLMEKPTIVSDTTGVRDYVEDGVTGVVVPPGDPAALRAAIEHVLDPANAEHYAEMGRRARASVLDRHLYAHYWDDVLYATATTLVPS